MAKHQRTKRLNIGNTDRMFNINLMRESDIEEKIKVTRLNEKEIEENMDVLEKRSRKLPLKDSNEYLVYQEKYTNDRLLNKLFSHGGMITYYTNTIIPYYVLQKLSMNLNSEVVYSIRKPFSDEEQENIELSYMATRVIIDIPVVIPDMNPYDILFTLEKLKTNVDSVQISFPRIHKSNIKEHHKEYYEKSGDFYYAKPNYKYMYFKYVQTSLSIWKMNIYLVANDDDDYKALEKLVNKEVIRRNPTKYKGVKVEDIDSNLKEKQVK